MTGYSRRPPAREGPWDEIRGSSRPAETDFSGIDVLVHLAGEPLFALWTPARKRRIRDSRVEGTRELVQRLRDHDSRPHTLISASGISIYGDRGDDLLTETAEPGGGFLAELCRDWEAAALEAAGFCRVATLRISPVLGRGGGMASLLRKVFRTGLGGRLGSGRQWMSWIHIDDFVRLVIFLARTPGISGPVNAVSPQAVTNRDFTRAVAAAVRRPALVPVPAWAVRALPGGMGEFILSSHRVVPEAATAAGFTWRHPDFAPAAQDALG